MFKKSLLAILFVLLLSGPAFCDSYKNGSDLLAMCQGDAPSDCLAYIAAVVDTYDGLATTEKVSRGYCPAVVMPIGQLKRVVVKHLKAQPEVLNYSASGLVLQALSETFPCQ